ALASCPRAPDTMRNSRRERSSRVQPPSIPIAGIFLSLAIACGVALRPGPGRADAALAVGLPSDVAKQGLALGYALNYATKETAQAEALKRCREFRDAPQATRDLCKIVENFRDRCVAIALDPEVGTNGLGWAVAKKQELAEDQA